MQARPPRSLWILLLTLFIVSRPLQSPELWWDLARGREVLQGAVRPCHQLLALDNVSEAAWLGGVPFFVLWNVGGVLALACVPLMAGMLLVRPTARASFGDGALPSSLFVAVLLLFAVRADLEPTAWLFDLLGQLTTWAILQRRASLRATLWMLGVAFAVWANVGPRPLWGLLLVVLWPGPLTGRGKLILVAVAGGMLTPRGPLTWLDSLVVMSPSAWVPAAELTEARWRSGLTADWSLPLIAGVALWGIAAVRTWRTNRGRLTLAESAMLLVPVIAVGLAQQNLAPASLWTALWWTTLERRPLPTGENHRSPWFRPVVLALTGLVIADASGAIVSGSDAMGWGISQSIDPRLLQIDDAIPERETVHAWCADSRSAGVAAWACRKAKLVDHPLRALLGARTPIHAALRNDLLTAHQWRYRRDDGSWGGWAHRLREWKAGMLFIAAEDAALHGALIETPWKLIRLDSPTAPYASGENSRFDRPIVEVMRQQDLVEAGPWQPSPDIYDAQGWRLEASSLLGFAPSAGPAIRQAAFFRAIQSPMAAVRALGPVRPGSATVRGEFMLCQAALARAEWVASGRVSRFRREVLASATSAPTSEMSSWAESSGELPPMDDRWRRSVTLYRDGLPMEAAAELTGTTGDDHYARGLLWMEAGEIGRARDAFRGAAAATEGAGRIVVEHWLEQIAPAENG